MEEVKADTTPCRVAYKRYALSLAKECIAEIKRIVFLKDKQKKIGGRHSLTPKILSKRIWALMAASQQALHCAAVCLREELDEENERHWIMPSMPPLEAANLLPKQSQDNLNKLGTYSTRLLPLWVRKKRGYNDA